VLIEVLKLRTDLLLIAQLNKCFRNNMCETSKHTFGRVVACVTNSVCRLSSLTKAWTQRNSFCPAERGDPKKENKLMYLCIPLENMKSLDNIS
jgi:hypothetical protein